MPRGAMPGERRGGRAKGTPNKRTVGIAAPVPDFRALVEQRKIARIFLDQAEEEREKLRTTGKMDVSFFNECLKNASRVLEKIAPYEDPKLVSLKVGGDAANPLHHVQELDLSRLSDEQLLTLRSILVALADPVRGPDGTATTH
jgi:hypothetical protein